MLRFPDCFEILNSDKSTAQNTFNLHEINYDKVAEIVLDALAKYSEKFLLNFCNISKKYFKSVGSSLSCLQYRRHNYSTRNDAPPNHQKVSNRKDDPVHMILRFITTPLPFPNLGLHQLSHPPNSPSSSSLKTYAYPFNCDLIEVTEDLSFFQNLGDSFSGDRHISPDLVYSPADGIVVNQGIITNGEISHVKEITYSFDALLGPGHTAQPRKGNDLYFSVIYLAPRDYHHFLSPTDWVVKRARQVQGEMFSVNPTQVGKWNVFCVDERVSLEGTYRYEFCGMVAVAATNVGNLVVDFWKDLRTNHGHVKLGDWVGEVKVNEKIRKGGNEGGFKLGSTVVVIWEGTGLKFKTVVGDRVILGQGLSF